MLGFFSIISNPNKFQVILGILAVVVVLILLLGILYNKIILCFKPVLNLVFSFEFPQSQRWPCSFPSLNYGRKYGLATAFMTLCWVQTISSVTLGHIFFLNSTPFLCHLKGILVGTLYASARFYNLRGLCLRLSSSMHQLSYLCKVDAGGSFYNRCWANLKHRDISHTNVAA